MYIFLSGLLTYTHKCLCICACACVYLHTHIHSIGLSIIKTFTLHYIYPPSSTFKAMQSVRKNWIGILTLLPFRYAPLSKLFRHSELQFYKSIESIR